MNVKAFEGTPTVFVISAGNAIGITTAEHLKNANKPLRRILQDICTEAKEYANKIYDQFDYPDGKWYPCGSADVVLRWNDHRDIINLFKKEASSTQHNWFTGWFGRLFKTSNGWWWKPKLDRNSQSMLYEEEVCRFVRQQMALADIKVDVRTYID